ncbi:pentapeptide repeat-containing protein [Fusibacter sp. 3D3]|uniref:pentapeptide repeat-containing protein n=1 Tax=Fusibacter sp. 3D3 TaxID=1048380 RepID=UPI00085369E4|nr:pentapeptide repeat-containing protein [Fusibacter sp. 3D3]GAU78322.1 quinolone resistance protein [Fusibacter sp. 3D3]
MTKKAKEIKINVPQIPKSLHAVSVDEIGFESEELIESIDCFEGRLENQEKDCVYIRKSIFKDISFKGTRFHRLDLQDVIFENCDFSNVDFTDSIIHKTVFKGCKITGANFSNTTLMNVKLENCNGKYANFRFAQIKKSAFENSNLDLSDYQNAVFDEVWLEKTSFRESQCSGAKLNGLDFRTCDIEGLGARIEDLKGIVITAVQAVSIARILGVVIKD